MSSLAVALDILLEAAYRKWFLALAIGITLLLLLLGLFLRLEVVDGALAATRLFGASLDTDIRPADVALRPFFTFVAYATYYVGIVFGLTACADFAPSLMAPGRIEAMLALPLQRWELLLGTFLGVMALAVLGAIYAAGGVTLIVGLKSGVWNAGPLAMALFGCVAFAAVHATMLVAALFVRSAAFSTVVGTVLFILGAVASHRTALGKLFEEGVARTIFEWSTLPIPRFSSLAKAGAALVDPGPVHGAETLSLVLGVLFFAASVLLFGAWRFERKDF